jgi:hypothetical protein
VSTLTIRLPDDKYRRLRELARRRSMSLNKLMEELATISITEFDAETRFRALAARGSPKKGLALIDKLDAAFAGLRRRGPLPRRHRSPRRVSGLPPAFF